MIQDEFNSAGFRYIVALLQQARLSEAWQKKHPKYDYQKTVEGAWDALINGDDEAVYSAAVNLTFPLYAANDDTDDALWFFTTSRDSKRLRAMLPAVLAVANFDMRYYSIREIAELSGLSESPWRNRCQDGKVPGAVLVGNSWMIPEYVAILKGWKSHLDTITHRV